MELIKTNSQTASGILEAGNRKITLGNGYKVEWINTNNETCFAKKGHAANLFDNEDVEFFINVPESANKVF